MRRDEGQSHYNEYHMDKLRISLLHDQRIFFTRVIWWAFSPDPIVPGAQIPAPSPHIPGRIRPVNPGIPRRGLEDLAPTWGKIRV